MKTYCEVLPSRKIGEVRMNLREAVIVRYIDGTTERVDRKLTKPVEFKIAKEV